MDLEKAPQKLNSRAKAGLSCLMLLLGASLLAQSTPIIGLHAERGFLIIHSEDIAPIGAANPYGFGIDLSWNLDPDRHYQNCLCFPRLGLSLNYHDMDKPGILGHSIPMYGFLEPHYRIYDDLYFFLRAGMGFTYQDSPFDEQTNPLNQSYSLFWNTYVELGLGFEYRPASRWGIRSAFVYNHSSNGGIQEPNKGLNYPTWNIGVNYALRDMPLASRDKLLSTPPPPLRQWDIQLFLAGKAFDSTRNTYGVYGLELSYLHQFSRVSAWDVGMEFLQNDAYAEKLRQQGDDRSAFQVNLLAGHSFVMGKFTFSQQAGIYLWREYDNTPDWFQRYGVQYYFWRGWSAGANIRVHGHVAEFLDARIGYSFPRKRTSR